MLQNDTAILDLLTVVPLICGVYFVRLIIDEPNKEYFDVTSTNQPFMQFDIRLMLGSTECMKGRFNVHKTKKFPPKPMTLKWKKLSKHKIKNGS